MILIFFLLLGEVKMVKTLEGYEVPFPDVKNLTLKRKLVEYYENLDTLYYDELRYKEIPETLAVDYKYIEEGYEYWREGWIEKKGKKRYLLNTLCKVEETLWVGRYSPTIIEYIEGEPYVLLTRDSLWKKVYSKQYFSLNDTFWYIEFYPYFPKAVKHNILDTTIYHEDCKKKNFVSKTSDEMLWVVDPLYIPFQVESLGVTLKNRLLKQLEVIKREAEFVQFNHLFYQFYIFSPLFSHKSWAIDTISDWFAIDRTQGFSWEHIKVWWVEMHNNSVKKRSIKIYRLPWVDKSRCVNIAGPIYLEVMPTKNPLYITTYRLAMFFKKIGIYGFRYTRNFIYTVLAFPFFSSRILTFLFITILGFLIGFGIMKIVFLRRKNNVDI